MNRQESQEKDKDNCRVLVSCNNVCPAEKTPLEHILPSSSSAINVAIMSSVVRAVITDERRPP